MLESHTDLGLRLVEANRAVDSIVRLCPLGQTHYRRLNIHQSKWLQKDRTPGGLNRFSGNWNLRVRVLGSVPYTSYLRLIFGEWTTMKLTNCERPPNNVLPTRRRLAGQIRFCTCQTRSPVLAIFKADRIADDISRRKTYILDCSVNESSPL
jgi:hypothetical protein